MTAPRHPSVFTIAASANFADCLARGLLARGGGDPLALSSAIIYLPTRRAARGFGDAFARLMGGAVLLPQFRPLGDSDEDALLFDAASDGLELVPAITPMRRQLLLARLIRQFDRTAQGGNLSFAQAAALADSLAKVMDDVERQGADLGVLKKMLPGEMAQHWEGVTRFLDILHSHWPAILAGEQRVNPEVRRTMALQALAARLAAAPPDGLVIAAGSTGSIPATAQLLGVIARLPNGAVVLPGLDRMLDDESWSKLDPGHPQFGLHQLLGTIGCARGDVADWCDGQDNAAREALLRETLRPAPTTDAWRALVKNGGGDIRDGLNGMSLCVAADPAEEALTIALALRETLETPGRTAALVTPDRNLARRVAAEMARWGVAINDSAGQPLAHAAAGSFLCLLADAAQARFAPVPLLALLKHPFAGRGQDAATFRARARELDRWCLRGPRPDPGLDGIARAIAKAGAVPKLPQDRHDALIVLAAWWTDIAEVLAPLEKLFAQKEVALDAVLDAQVRAAEALACDADADCLLWRDTDGEAAFALIAALEPALQGLDPVEPGSWPALFRSLAMKTPVRRNVGQHPRLAILGPLEARLQRFDLTVLGGLNEGTWPGAAGSDPWFSRPMRREIGLEQPERSIGQSAHDFAMLAASPAVLITRAQKSDGAPTVASRWLQRLEQLVLGLEPYGDGKSKTPLEDILRPSPDFTALAQTIADVPRGMPIKRPAPCPPVDARPRQLSVTEIETWLRDPYAIYARHVLKLRPLDPLDQPVGPAERGALLHAAVEEFVRRFPSALPDDAAQELTRIAETLFHEAGIPKAALALWVPRFADAARGFIAAEHERRPDIAQPHVEVKGRIRFAAPGGDFTLTGRADRIDVLKDGTTAIVDYKSGATPTAKQVERLLAPQLPLEAAMLAQDGFGIGKFLAHELIYLSLANAEKAGDPKPIANGAALGDTALMQLKARVARFDDPATPYHPRVMPFRTDSEGDYDHLARVREWSAVAEET